MCDKLVDIPIKDLVLLRDLYKIDWPKHNLGYEIIGTYMKWFEKDPHVKHLRIYTLNGDWRDGTFVVADWNTLLFNTISKDTSRLEKALSLVDFIQRPIICQVESRLLGAIQKVILSKQLDYNILLDTKWYRLSHEHALKLPQIVPSDIKIKPIPTDDISKADKFWYLRNPGSETFLRRLAKYNTATAAIDEIGETVAWCFWLPGNWIGVLGVAPSHRQRGLGALMISLMASIITQEGSDVFAAVHHANIPSVNLFQKLGFIEIGTIYWLPPNQYKK